MLGLTPSYVATLRQRALREGTAALVRPAGRPRETGQDAWEQARAWRARGVRDAEIARRLGVNQSTVLRRLAGRTCRTRCRRRAGTVPEADTRGGAAHGTATGSSRPRPAGAEPPPPVPSAFVPGRRRPRMRAVRSRYAGAMLLHAFAARAGAGDVFAAAAGQDAAAGDVALLAAVSACFALGAATTEAFKHLAAAEAGPLAGLVTLPALRTLRPRLSAIADRADPLELQRMFASAMLAADPVVSNVYYVDDHFVPYTGAKPVGKGWNNKRGRAERGRADTHVTAHDGRAVCFVTGDPSGLSVTLPKALAELKKAVLRGHEDHARLRPRRCLPRVFTHCREQNVHWVTYRRAPLAVPAMLPVITAVTVGGKRRQITWAEEKVQVKDYGEARQLTLSEQGRVVLQVLTSDFDACPADILSWLKSRWREENFLKYASENYGIDKICDYAATIEVNTKIIDNPLQGSQRRDPRRPQRGDRRPVRRAPLKPGHHPVPRRIKRSPPPEDYRREEETQGRRRHPRPDPCQLRADQIDPGARSRAARRRRACSVLRSSRTAPVNVGHEYLFPFLQACYGP